MKNENLTNQIIKCFYKVYNTLGYGFLEKVYQNALYYELVENGLFCQAQYPIKVYYGSIRVGDYFADILVENTVILELKAVDCICEDHEYQLINYLKATDIEVGLLLNFGKKPDIRRKIFDNSRKRSNLNTDDTDSTDSHR
ncbi:MAG: GxxExxY protein [Bacteroidales bacterium]